MLVSFLDSQHTVYAVPVVFSLVSEPFSWLHVCVCVFYVFYCSQNEWDEAEKETREWILLTFSI